MERSANLAQRRNFGKGSKAKGHPKYAAEAISTSFLRCVLKGLGKSPRIAVERDMFGPRCIGTSLRSAGVRRMFLVW